MDFSLVGSKKLLKSRWPNTLTCACYFFWEQLYNENILVKFVMMFITKPTKVLTALAYVLVLHTSDISKVFCLSYLHWVQLMWSSTFDLGLNFLNWFLFKLTSFWSDIIGPYTAFYPTRKLFKPIKVTLFNALFFFAK